MGSGTKRLVIGITAHVDSGKTTLSEAMLYTAGKLRKLRRVDHQTAFLDTHPMERDRGITIFAHPALMQTGDASLTLLDTPGHVDFSAETERTMQVLDYAILVISGSDGVQSHTETLWRLIRRYQIPVFLFVNKMDLDGADQNAVMAELKQRLSEGCTDFSQPDTETFYENVALLSDQLMETYLENGSISTESLCRSIAAGEIIPCYFGSALKLEGIEFFLKGLEKYTLEQPAAPAFGAKVFKIAADEKGSRLTYLKITGGTLRVRDSVTYTGTDGAALTEKVSQIRFYDGAKFHTEEAAEPGMFCAVTGLSRTFAGQGLGGETDAAKPLLEPVMTYAVRLPEKVSAADAMKQLLKLTEEDPALHMVWNEALQEIHVQPMGEVQLEILQKLIAERFGYHVTFDQGHIAYQETIAAPVEGVGHYEPLCHYAEVHLLLEPLPPGKGLIFASDCSEDDLDRNWQRLILTHLTEKTHRGVLTGSPITDMRITLCAGKAHLKHTEGGDFRQATYRAVRCGLRKAKSVLLEPWYHFVLELPTECVGRAMTDIQQMHGSFSAPEIRKDHAVICGSAPVSGMHSYHREVTGYTHGTGRLICTVKGYAPCEDADRVIAEMGYDCDADVENTADSVFCAHGAGFAVKWNEVEQYMHLPSCLNPPPEKTAKENIPMQRSGGKSYDSFAEDKELMAIFERTYGKIHRDSRQALYTPKEDIPVYKSQKNPSYDGTEYVLVDGYNIIFAWDELKKLAENNLDAARSRLTHILCNCGYRQCRLILVFDAYKVKGKPREVERFHNIDIVYTKEAETADAYIEKAAYALSRDNRVRVATSDGMEQRIILGRGALRISAEEFFREVKQAEEAIRAYAAQMKQGRNTPQMKALE